ncbi:MAG: FAD-dependent oxidoreductase [Proteobacteria bacterium]|nr:FAD-dependent oxidoreductase [Pseudomonadota bacterium]
MRPTHDVIVIGAGAAGLTAAGGCARLGLRVALVERDRMGGECLHTGCVPSKALLAAARRAQAMRGTAMGVTGTGPAVDFGGVRAHVAAAIAAIAPHDSEARFAAWGVEVIRGDARFSDPHRITVAGRELSAPRIVLAVGSRPAVPPIPGLDETPYLTNETVFGLNTLPRHLLVLGGGAIGVEMAQAFRRLGAAVTVIEAGRMLGRADRQAADLVLRRLADEGVILRPGTQVVRACPAPDGVAVDLSTGERVDGSHLLIAAGRRPALDGLRLDLAGVAAVPDGIRVDACRRTSRKHIYAIGDCRAGPRLTHAAARDGALAVRAIAFGVRARARDETLPSVTYTEPELAQIGLTEAEARARLRHVQVLTEPFRENDRAVADGATEGFIKLIRVRRRVVGVTLVGVGAGELVLPWSLIMGQASLWGLSGTVVPYPTRSELSKAVAFAAYEPILFGRASHLCVRALAWLRRQAF